MIKGVNIGKKEITNSYEGVFVESVCERVIEKDTSLSEEDKEILLKARCDIALHCVNLGWASWFELDDLIRGSFSHVLDWENMKAKVYSLSSVFVKGGNYSNITVSKIRQARKEIVAQVRALTLVAQDVDIEAFVMKSFESLVTWNTKPHKPSEGYGLILKPKEMATLVEIVNLNGQYLGAATNPLWFMTLTEKHKLFESLDLSSRGKCIQSLRHDQFGGLDKEDAVNEVGRVCWESILFSQFNPNFILDEISGIDTIEKKFYSFFNRAGKNALYASAGKEYKINVNAASETCDDDGNLITQDVVDISAAETLEDVENMEIYHYIRDSLSEKSRIIFDNFISGTSKDLGYATMVQKEVATLFNVSQARISQLIPLVRQEVMLLFAKVS